MATLFIVTAPSGAGKTSLVEALIASDFAPVQGFVLTMAVMYVALNLLIDILYGVIDPRVRLEG
jgi:peptide/nickel transport system permease protein